MNCGGAFVPLALLIHLLSKEPYSASGLPGAMEIPVLRWEWVVGTWCNVLLTFEQLPISSLKALHLPQAYGLMLMLPIASLSYHSAGQFEEMPMMA